MAKLLTLAGIVGIALAGCATQPMERAQLSNRSGCDRAYMDQVDRASRYALTQVHWVNCPMAMARTK